MRVASLGKSPVPRSVHTSLSEVTVGHHSMYLPAFLPPSHLPWKQMFQLPAICSFLRFAPSTKPLGKQQIFTKYPCTWSPQSVSGCLPLPSLPGKHQNLSPLTLLPNYLYFPPISTTAPIYLGEDRHSAWRQILPSASLLPKLTFFLQEKG